MSSFPGARAGLFQPGAVQTGQFTAAKRRPNYNRITDKYPPRQASGGRGGASLPAQAVARGQAVRGAQPRHAPGPRGAPVPAVCELCPLPASGRGLLEMVPIWTPVLKTLPLPGFPLMEGPLLFGCFSALRMKTSRHPATSRVQNCIFLRRNLCTSNPLSQT